MAVDIRKPLRKFIPLLLEAKKENLNETDTVFRLVKFFDEVLGYDSLKEIRGEMEVKEKKYVDLAIEIEGVTRLLIEAKAAGIDLKDRHIEQAQFYASKANIPWVLLTNGVQWKLYHLTFDEGIKYDHAFVLDLASEDSIEKAAELLSLLHRKSIRKGEHEDYWENATALRPESIAKALFTESVLRLIRRGIKKRRQGTWVEEEDLAEAIRAMFSPEVRGQIGPLRISRTERRPRPAKHMDSGMSPAASPTPDTHSAPLPEEPPGSTPTPEVTGSDKKIG